MNNIVVGFLILVLMFFFNHFLDYSIFRKKNIKQEDLCDYKIQILELKHRAQLLSKDLEILQLRLKICAEKLRYIEVVLENFKARSLLSDFSLWWKTEGQYEYEIVKRGSKRKRENLLC